MADKIRKFIVTNSTDASDAAKLGAPCVYLFYRISKAGTLQRNDLPVSLKGGVMGIFCEELGEQINAETIAKSIINECNLRGFGGVLLDFPASQEAFDLIYAISPALSQRKLVQFVPISLSNAAPNAKIILPSALSGGSFEEMVSGFAEKYGAERICLEILRTCSDFTMPAHSPEGKPLTAAQFAVLREMYQPDIYFSAEMCTRYFTYRKEGEMHFVLFDDAASVSAKIDVAQKHDYYGALILYRDWDKSCAEILL